MRLQRHVGNPPKDESISIPRDSSGAARRPFRVTPSEVTVKVFHLAGAGLVMLAVAGCSDTAITSQPLVSANNSVASLDQGGTTDRTVNMMDACDGPSFGAQVPPVLCTRNGGVTFDQLIAQLTVHQSAGAWHFAPSQMDAKVGLTLFAVNKG